MGFKDPAMIAAYGPSGIGKTTDMIYSFPNALFIAAPGALKPGRFVIGFEPESREASTIMEATKIVEEEAKKKKYTAIVCDDFSLLADQTVQRLDGKFSGHKLWGEVRNAVIDFRAAARQGGMHIAVTAHESPPKQNGGLFQRGGPRLPGRMPEDFPTACDLVVRAAFEPNRRGWHAVYRCTPDDTTWVTKDRHGVTPDRAPMNTAEILRAAEYQIPRAPGLEWQEELVEVLANALLASPEAEAELVAQGIELAREHTSDDLHVRWVIRDALDRASLRRAKQNVFAMYL
jgi:hypothetical protein